MIMIDLMKRYDKVMLENVMVDKLIKLCIVNVMVDKLIKRYNKVIMVMIN